MQRYTPTNRKVNTPSKETVMKSAIFVLGFQANVVTALTTKHLLNKDWKFPNT